VAAARHARGPSGGSSPTLLRGQRASRQPTSQPAPALIVVGRRQRNGIAHATVSNSNNERFQTPSRVGHQRMRMAFNPPEQKKTEATGVIPIIAKAPLANSPPQRSVRGADHVQLDLESETHLERRVP
jgi:hypothetical protein